MGTVGPGETNHPDYSCLGTGSPKHSLGRDLGVTDGIRRGRNELARKGVPCQLLWAHVPFLGGQPLAGRHLVGKAPKSVPAALWPSSIVTYHLGREAYELEMVRLRVDCPAKRLQTLRTSLPPELLLSPAQGAGALYAPVVPQ